MPPLRPPPDPPLLRLALVGTAILLMSAACAPRSGSTDAAAAAAAGPVELDLSEYVGVWRGDTWKRIGTVGSAETVTLSVSGSRAQLELELESGRRTRLELRPTGLDRGAPAFDVVPAPAEPDPGIARVVLADPPFHDPGERRDGVRVRIHARTADGGVGRAQDVEVDRALTPGAGRFREYGETRLLLYRDWRHRTAEGPMVLAADHGSASVRIERDAERLLESNGWHCLSEARRTVASGRPTTIALRDRSGLPRLFLLHSRTPGVRLAYSLANTDRPRYISVWGRFVDHPVVAAEGNLELRLEILPPPGALGATGPGTEVTVFTFGSTVGDYGSGCRLAPYDGVVGADRFFRAVGSIALAVALEGVRRESIRSESALLQALATVGRDRAIESAIREVAPDAPESAVEYYARWAAVLASREIPILSGVQDRARSFILEQIRRESPALAGHDELLGFLVDLHLELLGQRVGG